MIDLAPVLTGCHVCRSPLIEAVNKKMRDRNKNRGEDGEGSSTKKRRKREGGFSKEKTGQHFYNAVDVKGKRRRADRPN